MRFKNLIRTVWCGLIIAVPLTACSTEFSGGSSRFGGGGSKAKPTQPTGEPDPDEVQEQDPTEQSDDATKQDIEIDDVEQCIDRDPNFGAVLDFETPPNGILGASQANLIVLDQFRKIYGVSFSSSGNHQPVIRRTTRIGEPQPPSGEEAWLCILCNGQPSRNRLLDNNAEAQVGRFVLSSTAAAKNEGGDLRVDYKIPVASLSFDLIDVDGSEVWVIDAYDAANRVIPGLTQSITQNGYSTDRTGNGAPTRIDIATPTGDALIKAFVIHGQKPASKFGFAFDNFDPGIPTCN